MRSLEVSLIEWPEGPERGGPRLLGRTTDPDLVTAVSERLSAERHEDLSRLKPASTRRRIPGERNALHRHSRD